MGSFINEVNWKKQLHQIIIKFLHVMQIPSNLSSTLVDRWSLFRGHLSNKSSNWDLKMMVVIDRWLLAQV
jgi:hypothetical protein